MAIEKIQIQQFISLSGNYPVLDVRSPGEYLHAHIPGAYSLPLFTDQERAVVGTLYKQEGREVAIKAGLDYFGVKMRRLIEEITQQYPALIPKGSKQQKNAAEKPILVYCWRGGMRSAGVAWLLDLYGFKVFTLAGGYKSFRNWGLRQFIDPGPIQILGGYTGSGKTDLLHHIQTKKGSNIIDLEGLANHKGSAFGAIGLLPQPTQEMFENKLALEIFRIRQFVINNDEEYPN
ncbi:MAG: tRNA 2-selenouridine(34) synthase MnmH, partial [Chitinophagaceae bacterium]